MSARVVDSVSNCFESALSQAVSVGFCELALKREGGTSEKFPKIQILTIAELLDGKKLAIPRHVLATFKEGYALSGWAERGRDCSCVARPH
jgi:hypothetical protein